MEAPLAIYEALLQANVSPAAARDAAEKLERDMTTALAIRHDLQQLDARVQVLDARFEAVDARFEAVDAKLDLLRKELDARFAVIGERFVSLEQRIVVKLGVLMTVLIGAAGGLQLLLG